MAKTRKPNSSKSSELSTALVDLGVKISDLLGEAKELITEIPELALYRAVAPTAPNSCSYAPSLLVIPQGRKRVTLGATNYVFGQSQFLLTSAELPIVSQVVTASEEKPYLAFFLKFGHVRSAGYSESGGYTGTKAGLRAPWHGDRSGHQRVNPRLFTTDGSSRYAAGHSISW